MGSARSRVLVTGAGGFIGRNLLAAAPDDWDILAMTRDPTGLGGQAAVSTPAVDDDLAPALVRGFDVIVHLAGNSNHGLADREPWSDLAATGLLAASLLGRIRARRIVLLSSAAVYAGLVGPVTPEACPRPAMPYALSKLYVEGLVESLRVGGRIESSVVLRLYNAFGPGERPGRLIPRVVAAARAGLPFSLTGAPWSLSDPVHVDDVVANLVAAAEAAATGTFDLCGGDPVPLERQVGRITEALALPDMEVLAEPREGESPIQFHSDPAPLCRALGIDPPEPFMAAVRRYGAAEGWVGA